MLTEIWRSVVRGLGRRRRPLTETYRPMSRALANKPSIRSRPSESELGREHTISLSAQCHSFAKPSECHTESQTERNKSMIKSKVLVVDDEESIRNLVKTALTQEGRQVLLSSHGQDAIEIFRKERPDITILDIHMPDLSGIEVLKRIRAVDHRATVMIFTGSCTDAMVKQAQELGVTEVLEKGSSLSAIWEARTRRV